jgi:hypothetical protein
MLPSAQDFTKEQSPGIWSRFVATVRSYVGDSTDNTESELECPLSENERVTIHENLNQLRLLNSCQDYHHHQALFFIRRIGAMLLPIKMLMGYPDAYPQAVTLFESIELTLFLANTEAYTALETRARTYFEGLEGIDPDSIQFTPKLWGEQLGVTMNVLLNHQLTTYHIKTHHHGTKTHTLPYKCPPVDPYELFVYRFLEIAGLGAEVHFFWDSAESFYIATRDVSCGDDDLTSRPVFSYQQLQDEHVEQLYVSYEGIPGKYLSPVVQEAWVSSDILSRILGLSDIIDNPGNICLVSGANALLETFYIVDFVARREHSDLQDCRMFINGWGEYSGVPEPVLYFLCRRAKEKRIAYARSLFTISELIQWIDDAERTIIPVMEELNQTESAKERGIPVDVEEFRERINRARRDADVFLRLLDEADLRNSSR